ncbi:MAG: hypothetical protein ACYDB4_19360 [Candidatus Dormibacteraceae bacterium]
MTGATLKTLISSAGISVAELSRELAITPTAVNDSMEAMRLRLSTQERYLFAISRLIRAKAAERERLRVEATLAELSA